MHRCFLHNTHTHTRTHAHTHTHTHTQVVIADGRGKKGGENVVGIGAFVMPNAPIDDRIPLSAFAVPLEPLEQLAGELNIPQSKVCMASERV